MTQAEVLKVNRNISTPVYYQVRDQLRKRIVDGAWIPGTQIPGARELSKEFGVAYRTMVRSLQLLRKEGLLIGGPSRGTFVKAKPNLVKNIAVTINSSYHLEKDACIEHKLMGIGRGCDSAGFHFQMFALRDAVIFRDDQPTLLAKFIREGDINGVITCGPHPPEDIAELVKMGVPVVSYRDEYLNMDVPWVREDVADGARQLVNLLVDGLGHRHIRFVMGSKSGYTGRLIRPSALLADSLVRELEQRGIPCSENAVFYGDFHWENIAPIVRQWLIAPNRPTAIIFCSDDLAIEGIRLARELGFNVPNDLSIASYGDFLSDLSLTSVNISMEEMGRKAVEMLQQIIQGHKWTPQHFPVKLMVRKTCGTVPRV